MSDHLSVANGKITVKIPCNDTKLRDTCKYLLKFIYKAAIDCWVGQDNAIHRVILGIPLPENMPFKLFKNIYTNSLRDYQKKDVAAMISKGSMLNANDMGLGKTLETLITLQHIFHEKVLIVVPKSVMFNWHNELIKWGICTEQDISIITGSKKCRRDVLNNLGRFIIVNYDLIASKKDKNKKETNELLLELQKYTWDVIIADEAHRIKNRNAQRSIGLKSLQATNRFALTGTPIQNRPDDLWNILNWINPFYSGGSYWTFVELFCELEDNGFGVKPKGLTKNTERIVWLNMLLSHIMIRNEKRHVLKDLPEKIYQRIPLQMTDMQTKLYSKIKKEILFELDNGSEMSIPNALIRLLRLQQVTSNPGLFGIKENPKFASAIDIITGSDSKVIVFSRFLSTIEAFKCVLSDQKIKYVEITGAIKHNRQDIIKKFESDPEIKVFLGTIGAAGEGIDGLQHVADKLIFFDREWSPSKNAQAEDRIYRIGQTRGVQITDLIMENTIDNWVETILNRKLLDIRELIK